MDKNNPPEVLTVSRAANGFVIKGQHVEGGSAATTQIACTPDQLASLVKEWAERLDGGSCEAQSDDPAASYTKMKLAMMKGRP